MEKTRIDFHLRLDKTPSLRELYLFKVQAKPRGVSRLSWPYVDGRREYSLLINTCSMFGLIEWELYLLGRAEDSMVWSRTTSDVVHVFNVVRARCDQDARVFQSAVDSVAASAESPVASVAQQQSLQVVASLKKLFDTADPGRQSSSSMPCPQPAPSRIEPTELNQLLAEQGSCELRVLTYTELLFHLKREILRHSCTAAPYSLVLLKIRFKEEWDEADRSPLNAAQSAEVVRLIYGTKRPKDLIGVHRSGNLAIILPGTDSVGTNAFVDRLSALLRSAKLPDRPTFSQLKLTFACASVPENCSDVSTLLQTAESGLLQVSENRLPIVAYSRFPLAK